MNTILFSIFRKRTFTTLITVLMIGCLSGCSTIEFVQHQQASEQPTINKWHHSTLNGMVEISKPLDIRAICGKKAWTTITSEFTFYNAMVGVLIPSTSLVSLYTPWTNKVRCYETQ